MTCRRARCVTKADLGVEDGDAPDHGGPPSTQTPRKNAPRKHENPLNKRVLGNFRQRRRSESNRLMAVLQTAAFPLRHVAMTAPGPLCGPVVVQERVKGLEPSTFCMASRRSSQLSYTRSRNRRLPNAACPHNIFGRGNCQGSVSTSDMCATTLHSDSVRDSTGTHLASAYASIWPCGILIRVIPRARSASWYFRSLVT